MKIDPNPDHFEYRVIAVVKFTAQDLRVLRYFAERHYDYKCKTFFEPGPGSAGNKWRGCFRMDGKDVDPFEEKECPADLECDSPFATATVRELDTCLKVLEGVTLERNADLIKEALRLDREIRTLIDQIANEYKRIMESRPCLEK